MITSSGHLTHLEHYNLMNTKLNLKPCLWFINIHLHVDHSSLFHKDIVSGSLLLTDIPPAIDMQPSQQIWIPCAGFFLLNGETKLPDSDTSDGIGQI